jgi:hypothetical protein
MSKDLKYTPWSSVFFTHFALTMKRTLQHWLYQEQIVHKSLAKSHHFFGWQFAFSWVLQPIEVIQKPQIGSLGVSRLIPVIWVTCIISTFVSPQPPLLVLYFHLKHPQSSHCKISLQTPFAETFGETLNLQRPLPWRHIQCNPITNPLFSSSYNHVATFLLVLAQNLPHLMDQSSTTCILVAKLIIYLELHLLCALIATIEEVLELIGSHWNI